MWTLLILALLFQLSDGAGSFAARRSTTSSNTTTPTTTTVTAVTGCAGCTMDNPAIEYVALNPGSVPILTDEVGVNNAGCAMRTISCIGLAPESTVFIAWNDDSAGTTMGAENANFVSGTLTCEDDMYWHLMPGGPAILTVECDST